MDLSFRFAFHQLLYKRDFSTHICCTCSLATFVAIICQNTFSQKCLCVTSQAKSLPSCQRCFSPLLRDGNELHVMSGSQRSWLCCTSSISVVPDTIYFVIPKNTFWAFRCFRAAVIGEGTGLCSAVSGDLCSHLSKGLWCSLLSFQSLKGS